MVTKTDRNKEVNRLDMHVECNQQISIKS